MTTRATLTWHGDNRFVGRGASGAPVLINFAPGETAAGAPASEPAKTPTPGAQPAAGPMPTELLLIATGACTGLDIISLLQKQRVPFTGLELEVTGERAEEHPRYFTDVEVVYRLGAAPEALPHLERAARLSMDKYCSVGHSLRAKKTWRCELVGEQSPRD